MRLTKSVAFICLFFSTYYSYAQIGGELVRFTVTTTNMMYDYSKDILVDSKIKISDAVFLNDHANKAISLAHRYDSCLTLMVLDIDGLSQINEKYSHSFGDEILKTFSALLKDAIRDSDILVRYSGEEFLILLPMSSLAASQPLGKRLLQQTRELSFNFKNKEVKISTTIGTASLESPHDDLDALLAKTYNALDVAKQEGKDRLVSYIDEKIYKTEI